MQSKLRIGLFTLLSVCWLQTACSDDSHDTRQDGGILDSTSNQDGTSQRDASDQDAHVPPDGSTDDGGVSPTTPFSFLVYGDSRAGGDCTGNEVHIALVDRMTQESDIAFVVNLGDMITGYADQTCFADNGSCTGDDDYGSLADIIEPLASRAPTPPLPVFYFPVIGNHDDNGEWYPDPCGGTICDVFDMEAIINHPTPNSDPCGQDYPSQAYYDFRLGNTAFFVLHANYDYFSFFECNYPPEGWDSCEDYCKNGPHDAQRSDRCYNVHQYDWLVERLQAADDDPDIHHKVIFLHAPIYTSFEDHQPFTSAPDIAELADQYHVALVFNGHNHTYERTVPIKGGEEDATGTVYVTTSGGGVQTWDVAGDWFTAAHSDAHHYVRVDVTSEGLSVTATAQDGSEIDSFAAPQ